MNKAGIANRLSKAGLRNAAEAYREEVRQRLAREQGGKDRDRDKVSLEAWQQAWEVFRPVVEKWEQKKEVKPEPPQQLPGLPREPDGLLDPEYREADPGRQLRDGWLWVVFEWARVIEDTPNGPVAHLDKASKPPPNAFALTVLSTYALSDVDKRRDLIARALAFAEKAHDAPQTASNAPEIHEPFLDSLG